MTGRDQRGAGSRRLRRRLLTAGCAALAIGGAITAPLASRADAPAFSINKVSKYGGEPSLTSDANGTLYEASLLAPQTFRSTDGGKSWTAGQHPAFNSTGDDCLGTDQSLSVYLCNLTITGPSKSAALQADAYMSDDQGNHWIHGGNTTGGDSTCGTSCNPFGVDRDWIDAWIPPKASKAEVVLFYHDFYGPSHLWVNISTDGGATFGRTSDVLATSTGRRARPMRWHSPTPPAARFPRR